jgi:hypothetical protein
VIDQNRIKLIARLIGWLAVVAIGVLSLVPGDMRPHTGAPGTFEHVAAYFGAAGMLAFGYGNRRAALATALSLPLYSAAFEIAQSQIPGRHAAFSDFVASTIGVIVGSGLAWIALKVLNYISGRGSV